MYDFDPKAINKMHAQNGKKSLLMTAVLAVAIIGGLVWMAFHLLYDQVEYLRRVNAPALAAQAEYDLTAFAALMAVGIPLAVICWALMWEGNDRYWGVK